MDELLQETYNRLKEEIYGSENIVNIKEVKKYHDEIIKLDEYIPNLIRPYMSKEYFRTLNGKKNILNEMLRTRKASMEEDVVEFVNWIDSHKQFQSCILEDKMNIIADKLEDLEKEFNDYNKIIK